MKKATALPAVMLIFSCTACRGKAEYAPDVSALEWGEVSHGLRVSLDVPDPRFEKGESAFVYVILEKTFPGEMDLSAIPAFVLGDMRYWCPVDLAGDGLPLPANAEVRILLRDGEPWVRRMDLSKLSCEEAYSSRWPAAGFYSILPAGKNNLRLDFEVVGGMGGDRIRSNEVTVEISP
ncbi:MAG: hypothetical protein JW929_13965 [Anaerolineales bacterium]|nr:hypothetical protein [Anaerolineales bacterium]